MWRRISQGEEIRLSYAHTVKMTKGLLSAAMAMIMVDLSNSWCMVKEVSRAVWLSSKGNNRVVGGVLSQSYVMFSSHNRSPTTIMLCHLYQNLDLRQPTKKTTAMMAIRHGAQCCFHMWKILRNQNGKGMIFEIFVGKMVERIL